MKIIEQTTSIQVFDKINELPRNYRMLLKIAKEAAKDAYAPYSKFKVGAAVLLENGRIFLGNNQENASYPVGQCAERVAMFSASALYPNIPFRAVAITAFSSKKKIKNPIAPCGSCRQVFAEYEMKHGKNIEIILMGSVGKIYLIKSAKGLLPLAFSGNDLK